MTTLAVATRADYAGVSFYGASAALAACWVIGWWIERPIGPIRATDAWRRHAVLGCMAGAALGLLTYIGAWTLRDATIIGPSMAQMVGPVTAAIFAPLAITAAIVGASEELMFRDGTRRWFATRPAPKALVLYVVATCATGSLALVIAAAVLGAAASVARHRTGGITAPIALHVSWSLVSLATLPSLL